VLPNKPWRQYESDLRAIGEDSIAIWDDDGFLAGLGFVAGDGLLDVHLTQLGREFFLARFVQKNEERATGIVRTRLLELPETSIVVQMLFGVAGADRESVGTLLKFQGLGDYIDDATVGVFVAMLNKFKVISYARKTGRVRVLVDLAETGHLPAAIFVSPKTPYGNEAWLRRIIKQGDEYLWWFDKHFLPVAFDSIWEAADGNSVTDIRILSLRMPDHDGQRSKKAYRNLRTELSNRKITLEWRVINLSLVKDTHDRWLVSKQVARNLPNVNAIFSGQNSEMIITANVHQLQALFGEMWEKAENIEVVWAPPATANAG